MTKFLRLLLALIFILQLLVSAGFELAHDEAYYWLFSNNLDWGYFDHPPFVAVLIRMFSFLPGEWGIRLGFILLQFLTLLIIFSLIDKRFYLRATLLFFAFPLASLTGLLALPDIPLLFMTAVYCYLLNRFLLTKDMLTVVTLGVSIAVLLYAKYHGILLIFFTILALPKLFKDPKFYLVALVAILCFLPHVWWQYQHDFATLRYHFLERPSSAFSLKRSLEFVGVQIGLAGVLAGPLVWWTVLRKSSRDDFERAMKFISIGSVLFFLFSTLSKKFEANWTIFLAVPLIYLSAGAKIWEKNWARILLITSFVLVLSVRLLFLLPPETLGLKRLREFNGWKAWAQEVKAACSGSLVANTYQIASKLSYYLAEDIHSLNLHSRKNQFDFWRWDLKNPIKDVCYVSDNQQLGGNELVTPEGKRLWMVKNIPYEVLLQRKAESMR